MDRRAGILALLVAIAAGLASFTLAGLGDVGPGGLLHSDEPGLALLIGWLPVLSALVMAVSMTIPMVLLMSHHHHGRRATCEMTGSMIAPTLAAAALHAVGAIPAGQVRTVAHLGMFPAMFLVMLARYSHYATAPTARHGHTTNQRTHSSRTPS